ncbi:MAG: hypothetical protein WCK32_01700 [Chlorobiaceae bacterium]
MKDAKFFEFPGSGIVQNLVFAGIVCLKVFDIWDSNWIFVILVAFIGSAVVTAIVSSFWHSGHLD